MYDRSHRSSARALRKKKCKDSSTRVNYPQSVLSGVRKTTGFKCDTGLYSAFKTVAQAYFGSVCKPLECFMLAVLALKKEQVNFGETVKIERLHIERNLRSRRNLVVEEQGSKASMRKPEQCCDLCSKAPVVAIFEHEKGFKKKVCEAHEKQLMEYPKWRLVKRALGDLSFLRPSEAEEFKNE